MLRVRGLRLRVQGELLGEGHARSGEVPRAQTLLSGAVQRHVDAVHLGDRPLGVPQFRQLPGRPAVRVERERERGGTREGGSCDDEQDDQGGPNRTTPGIEEPIRETTAVHEAHLGCWVAGIYSTG